MKIYIKKISTALALTCLILLTLISCKSKAIAVDSAPKESNIKAKNIIENHYNNKIDFSTLYIKSKVHFENEKTTQNVTAEIKIKKDEQILVSIRFLGITMAKALITPTAVNYYEKMGSSYYEGDFSQLSEMLGTDLDYQKLQNLLLGEAIDNLKKGKYTETFVDGVYRLDAESDGNMQKTFYLDADKYLIQKQQISQELTARMIQVAYSNSKEYNGMFLPSKVDIDAYQKGKKSQINFEYDTITLNEELSFPYSVPNGYKRIKIK